MRRIGLYGGILFLLMVTIYTGVWFYAAHRVEKEFLGIVERVQRDGGQVGYARFEITGYPLKLRVNVENIQVTRADVRLTTPLFVIEAWPWEWARLHIPI